MSKAAQIQTPAQKIGHIYGPGLAASSLWEYRNGWHCIQAGTQIPWMRGLSGNQAGVEVTRRGLSTVWLPVKPGSEQHPAPPAATIPSSKKPNKLGKKYQKRRPHSKHGGHP